MVLKLVCNVLCVLDLSHKFLHKDHPALNLVTKPETHRNVLKGHWHGPLDTSQGDPCRKEPNEGPKESTESLGGMPTGRPRTL